MKKTALIVAALMVGGSAFAQTGSTGDPYDMTQPDTDVSADTTVDADVDAADVDVDADVDATVDTTPDTDMSSDWSTSSDATMSSSTTAEPTAATGVGGPYQPATGMAMNAPTSKGGYPPCNPGPGDDMCIQLYESGVRAPTNLAMNRNLSGESTMMASASTTTNWNNSSPASTSTSMGTSTATGMGGPYEPVNETGNAAGTNYPACDPGPGDDNCIQLYERGVTR